jgi:hypothetical protein
MPDEQTPASNEPHSAAKRLEEAMSDLPTHVPGVRDPIVNKPDGITGIRKTLVGFQRDGETVDAVEALARLFTAIGDLLRLAEVDGPDEVRSAIERSAQEPRDAGKDEPPAT